MAQKIEKMEYFHSREKQHNSWVKQAAEALDIDVEDDLLLGTSITVQTAFHHFVMYCDETAACMCCVFQDEVKMKMMRDSSRS